MGGEWKRLSLREAGISLIDCDHRTPPRIDMGYPYVGIPQLREGRIDLSAVQRISPENFVEWTRRAKPTANDVVLSRRCNPGETAFVPPDLDFALGQNLVLLRSNGELVYPPYLRWMVRGPQWWEQVGKFINVGAVFESLKCADIPKFELMLPSLSDQRAIAHILGTLDDKIELNRRRNQTLEAMARALFQDWFVDFGPVRARRGDPPGRPYLPADLWRLLPERLDEAGKPAGWEMVPASELIEFNPSEPLRKGTHAPYLDMASLPTTGSSSRPPITRSFGSGMRFRNGDTLMARITPCLENGKTAFVQCLPDDAVGWGSTEFIVMRSRTPVPAEYTYLLARDTAFRDHAIRSMTGTSGRQRAQADSVAAFKLASPSDDAIWHAFSKLIAPMFESIKVNAAESDALAQLRDTLLPKLISGELRVADAEKFVEHVAP